MRRRSGFTLLEVLLSLALTGLLFVGLNTFIFSMGELWGRNGDVRLFDQHVNAVTRFVGQMFREATLPPSARANSTPVAIQQITPQSGVSDFLITFELPAGNRMLIWPDRPLPEVVCSLQARPDGLYLLWQSRLETNFTQDPPREVTDAPRRLARLRLLRRQSQKSGRPRLPCRRTRPARRNCPSGSGCSSPTAS